jgi:hypothetical protein
MRDVRIRPQRRRLLDRLPGSAVCAEIGVWQGHFSSLILDLKEPRQFHLIDPWSHEEGEEYQEALYGGRCAGQEEMDRIYREVVDRFATEIESGRVSIHRQPSLDAVSAFPNHYFDWIYIDGNHLYEYVKADLASWAPKVKSGGLIAGDDYVTGKWWGNGVVQAVNEFASKLDIGVSTLGSQFLLKVP